MVDRDEKGHFLPGSVGNPKGRPKLGEALTDVLRERIDKQEIADKLLAMAREGNVTALKYVFDRIDGMPSQHIEMSNEKDAEWLELFRGAKRETEGDTT